MKVPKRGTGAEPPVVATKAGRPTGAKGWRHPAKGKGQPREREEPASKAKPFQRLDDRSRMNREVHVRFCESLGVKFPRATRHLVPREM